MRKNIYDVLHSGEISLKTEYDRLYSLLHQDNLCAGEECMSIYRLAEHACKYFDLEFTNRAISLKEIEKAFGYTFSSSPRTITIDLLVSYCELISNLCYQLNKTYKDEEIDKEYLTVVSRNTCAVMDELGYSQTEHNGVIIFIEKAPAALSVAEIVDEKLAFSVLEYNHHRLKGNLDRKHMLLKRFADDFESKRRQLKSIAGSVEIQLGELMNKFVRHDHSQTPYIASMTETQLEGIYDDIYQLYLLGNLQLDNLERKKRMAAVLSAINGK